MPEKFSLEIDPEAFNDIQQAVNYYNSAQKNLGKRFFDTVDSHFDFLKNHYFAFAIRYDDIRCMPVKNFPYMIHYQVLKKLQTVSVKAVFCTYDNPEIWDERIG